MPAGPDLINQVASVLTAIPTPTVEIWNRLPGAYSLRAVRYALTALKKQKRAKVKQRRGHYVAMELE